MIAYERRRRMLELLEQDRSLSLKRLQALFKVSPMTLWRDLQTLEAEEPRVRRVRGGVVLLAGGEPEGREGRFGEKLMQHGPEKVAIARLAAKQVRADSIVIVEGGTTAAGIMPYLNEPGLTVLTNSLAVLREGAERKVEEGRPELTLLASGGVLRPVSQTLVGPEAERFFLEHRSQLFFMGATGVTLEEGLTDPNPLEIQVKRRMLESAEKVVVMLDSSKFGRRSLMPICDLGKVDLLISDRGMSDQWRKELRERGIEVQVAAVEDADFD